YLLLNCSANCDRI
ncbi:unnamed protein product, partial [Allacma fusca]